MRELLMLFTSIGPVLRSPGEHAAVRAARSAAQAMAFASAESAMLLRGCVLVASGPVAIPMKDPWVGCMGYS